MFGSLVITVMIKIILNHGQLKVGCVQLIKLNFTTETVRPKLVEGSVSVMVRQAHHEREP